jgi:Fur family transcriptional regulator, ferric uptake regulator
MQHEVKAQNADAGIKDLLKKNYLSVTAGRKKILELFLKQHSGLSHSEIEKRTGDKFDRVTIYRTLQTFTEKGIIHIIPTEDNTVVYALCKNECTQGHHHDNHIHFTCEKCGKTRCLDDVVIPEVKMPRGFLAKDTQMIVKGLCNECR